MFVIPRTIKRSVLAPFLAVLLADQVAQKPLESFQLDAEKALGKRIVITESDKTGIANGQTFCDQDPIAIVLRSGLLPDLKDQVLAHELGHAILCSRGIAIFSYSTEEVGAKGLSEIVGLLGSTIGSCYIDPLADAEAERRGFRPETAVDALLKKTASHTKDEIHEAIARYGELSSALPAIAVYCSELRPHNFSMQEVEKVFADEPSVMSKLQALRKDIGRVRCDDSMSCYALTRRLRDECALGKYLRLSNPSSRVLE